MSPELSVVIPLLDEEPNVDALYAELTETLDAWGRDLRDGLRRRRQHRRDLRAARPAAGVGFPRMRVVRLRRNFGQTAAFSAGFAAARGRLIATADGDLQNDLREIPRMVDKLDEGFDIVCGWRKARRDPWLSRRLVSFVANRLISRVTGVRLHDYGCSLKVFQAEVVRSLRLYGEMHRFIPAIASEQGVRIAEVVVNHRPRRHGRSKYGLSRTPHVVLDLVTVKFLLSYSTRPLQIFGLVGAAMGAAGAGITAWLAYIRLFGGQDIGRPAAAAVRHPAAVHGGAARYPRAPGRAAGADLPRVAGQADLPRPRGARDAGRRPGGGAVRAASDPWGAAPCNGCRPRQVRSGGPRGRAASCRPDETVPTAGIRLRSGGPRGRAASCRCLAPEPLPAVRPSSGCPGGGAASCGTTLQGCDGALGRRRRQDMPVNLAFLGCGFITGVHSRHLRRLREAVVCRYASREAARRRRPTRRRYRGAPAATPATPRRSRTRGSTRWWSRCRRGSIWIWRCGRCRPASTCSSRSRPSSGWRTTGACSEARDRAGRVVLVGENDHYKPLAVCLRRLLGRGGHRRPGARPLHDGGRAAEGGRRLAQRRRDGGRRRLLRGGHPLAAPRQQPGPGHHHRGRVRAGPFAARSRPPGQEHAGRVPVRERGGRRACSTRARCPRCCAGSGCRSCSGGTGSSPSSRTAGSCWCGAAACLGCCSRGCATSAATRPCTATSWAPSGRERPPEMSLETAMDDQRIMDQIYEADALSAPPAAVEGGLTGRGRHGALLGGSGCRDEAARPAAGHPAARPRDRRLSAG